MKATGKYFQKLETKSRHKLSKNQLHDSALHLHSMYYPEKEKSYMIFCNSDHKNDVRKNYFLKVLTSTTPHILVYSSIVSKLCSFDKRKVFYLFEIINNGNELSVGWVKEFPIKTNQCFNLLKISNSGHPGVEEIGLMVGKFFKIYTGGMAPNNYLTMEGMNRNLLSNFGLSESQNLNSSLVGIENLRATDGTIFIGSKKENIDYWKNISKKNGKPLFQITESDVKYLSLVNERKDERFVKLRKEYINWIVVNRIRHIHITGDIKQALMFDSFNSLIKIMSKNFPDPERVKKNFSKLKVLINETY